MASKKELIKELDRLEADYQSLVRSYDQKCRETYNPPPSPDVVKIRHAMTVSFDLWPLKDWFRFRISPFGPGRYFQLCIGPLRIDFFED